MPECIETASFTTGDPSLNPDFELYDNVGRDREQVSAHHTKSPTANDLNRWARRDAASFLARHPLPEPPIDGPDLRPFLQALADASTPAEACAVTNAVLDTVEPFIQALSEYLVAVGHRFERDPQATANSPQKVAWSAASGLLASMELPHTPSRSPCGAHTTPQPSMALPGSSPPVCLPARRRPTPRHPAARHQRQEKLSSDSIPSPRCSPRWTGTS
ncbi:hypothetical protein [Streptomyces lavendulae]|uniref:hypothetical protein n=1 Tax=Streptomyces lavendulae TaxID=1914 RepID=UPI0033D04EBD